MGRDWRKPRTMRSLRSHPPLQIVRERVQRPPAPECTECARGCGRAAEVIAVDVPDQVAMMEFGDRIARVPLCIPCLEAEDPLSWDDIVPIDPDDDVA